MIPSLLRGPPVRGAAGGALHRQPMRRGGFGELNVEGMFPAHPTLGATLPAGAAGPAFVMEAILTLVLMVVILSVSSGSKEKGVLASAIGPHGVRFVTHYDVDRAACERAAAIVSEALRSLGT